MKAARILVLLLLVTAPGPDDRTEDPATLRLTLGLCQSAKATTMYRRLLPLIEELQQRAEERLARPVDIHLRIFQTAEQGQDALVRGEVDVARLGPASYILCKERHPGIQLLVMELCTGQKTLGGAIIVRADSRIQSLWDLEGRSFAFGDRQSTVGRYLVQAELVRAGIYAQDLGRYAYLGSDEAVATAVLAGDFDAGGVTEGVFDAYNKKGQLRALRRFSDVTNPWMTQRTLAPEVFATLQASLLAIQDPALLAGLGISGFARACDRDYELVRAGIKASQYFLPSEAVAQTEP